MYLITIQNPHVGVTELLFFLMICVKCVYVCDKKPLPLRRTKAHLLCLNSIISELV